jgi:[CysO sulfur-carrier protein]-S-L-cysteine hydrolase
MQVSLRETHRQQVFEHCRAESPNEACGVLAGRGGRVEKVYTARNVVEDEKKPILYEIDPKDLLRIFQDIDESDLQFLGIFHSHVKSEAKPSATDIRLSYYPDAVYFMISLLGPEPELKAWKIIKKRIDDVEGDLEPVDLVVEPDEA